MGVQGASRVIRKVFRGTGVRVRRVATGRDAWATLALIRKSSPMRALFPLCFLATFAPAALAEDFQGSTHPVPFEEEIIDYSKKPAGGPIAELQARLDRGGMKLRFDNQFGWLPGLLDALHVPKSSQILVFSKTSLQRTYITPKNPRALYFSDDVYLGYIPGAPMMELSAVDPKLGGVFYSIEQLPARKPRFVREPDCLRCHGTARSMGVPGHILRSIGTDDTGEMDTQSESSPIDHCTPFAERWAGWYVTGRHGEMTHRGNLIGAAAFERAREEPQSNGNIETLGAFFDETEYIARGSDIVALMVLQHQAHMHNYITRLNFETQIMMTQYGHTRYLTKKVDAFLRYLLFTEETPLLSPLQGNPEFVKEFTARGPRDSQGRSLRDFDLQSRLFQHPCSFLIYSKAFDSLPPVMLDQIYRRLWDILHGQDASEDFAGISEDRRKAILEILIETKKGLPEYWRVSG